MTLFVGSKYAVGRGNESTVIKHYIAAVATVAVGNNIRLILIVKISMSYLDSVLTLSAVFKVVVSTDPGNPAFAVPLSAFVTFFFIDLISLGVTLD